MTAALLGGKRQDCYVHSKVGKGFATGEMCCLVGAGLERAYILNALLREWFFYLQ